MKPRALVVEDDPNIPGVLKSKFVALRHDFDVATNLEAARSKFESGRYDYAIVDLTIPADDEGDFPDKQYGLMLIREIRALKNKDEFPVIAMTSYVDVGFGLSMELHGIGVNACVSKNLEKMQSLVQVVSEVISKRGGSKSSEPRAAFGRSATPVAFSGGELVYSEKSVCLMGLEIISDKGIGHTKHMLEILREKRPDGRFIRLSGEKLAAMLGNGGIGVVTGCAKTIRDNIRIRLKRHLNIVCGENDVLVNDDQGYHLNDDTITARDAGAPGVDVPAVDPAPSVPRPGSSTDGANVPSMAETERLKWIMAKVSAGGQITRQQVQDKFDVSEKTAKRDLAELRDKLEFVRRPHPGFYRMAGARRNS